MSDAAPTAADASPRPGAEAEASPGARALVIAVGVFLLALAQVAVPLARNTWIYRDGRFYVNVNENLLDRGSLEDPFAHSWYSGELGWNYNLTADFSNLALGARGEKYHFRPWIMPVLSTPLYWAFGLFGVLLFNLLGFAVAAVGVDRFTRAYASSSASALATLGLLLAGGVRARVYDYSVDVLSLALLGVALYALVTRRGLLAGFFLGLTVLIKPPSILLAVPCGLILWERGELKVLLHAVYGGAIALGLGAAMNTYMFGRPWWFGYSRVLVVEGGVQGVVSDSDAFETPWSVGIPDLWSGPWGVARRWGLFALCLVGHAAMIRRRPRYVLGTVLTTVGMFLLFSRFPWRFDRFLFGAFALHVPALARALELIFKAAQAAGRRMRARLHPAALMAAVLAVAAALTTLGTSPPLPERMGHDGYVVGAEALAAGALDLTDRLGPGDTQGDASVATRTRFGTPVARAPLPAVLLGGLAFLLGGYAGLLVLHLLAGALLVYASTRLLTRVAPPWLAAIVAVGVTLVPPLSDAMIAGGSGLFGAALAALSLRLAASRRWVAAGALVGLSAWLADALLPWALLPALAAWWSGGRPAATRAGLATAASLGVYGLVTLAVIGRPFASPHDFVVAGALGAAQVSPPSAFASIAQAFASPGPLRGLTPLLVLAPLGGLWAALRRERLLGLALGLGALGLLVPRAWTSGAGWSATAAVVVCLGAGAALGALPRLGRWALARVPLTPSPRLAWGAAAVTLATLGVIGGVRRAAATSEPIRFATPRGVRHAEVTLGEAPCDFLAWELMSWECAILDGDGDHRTGLRLPAGIHAPGHDGPLLLLPTSQHRPRSPRTIAWELPAGEALALRVAAAPGPYDAAAQLTVRVDGDELARLDVPRDAREVEEHRFDTSGRSGTVRVELEMRLVGPGRAAAVALDGGFEGD